MTYLDNLFSSFLLLRWLRGGTRNARARAWGEASLGGLGSHGPSNTARIRAIQGSGSRPKFSWSDADGPGWGRIWRYSLKLPRSPSKPSCEPPQVTSHCWRSPISWPDRSPPATYRPDPPTRPGSGAPSGRSNSAAVKRNRRPRHPRRRMSRPRRCSGGAMRRAVSTAAVTTSHPPPQPRPSRNWITRSNS